MVKAGTKSRYVLIGVLAAASIAAVWLMYLFLPTGTDWFQIRWSVLDMLQGRSPYTAKVFNPPWTLVMLTPLAVLPFKLSVSLLSFLSIISLGLVSYKMSKYPLSVILIMLTPAAIRQVVDPNLEWMVALGFILPPQIGLFFILSKPQLGLPLTVFWLVEAFRRGGWREAVRVFAPLVIVTLLSFAVFGLWPLNLLRLQDNLHNVSMWPTSIPFGLALLWYAVSQRQKNLAILSAPFLAPYYGFYSLHIPLLGLLSTRWELALACAGMWVMFFL